MIIEAKKGFDLDPRTKLLLILVMGMIVAMKMPFILEGAIVLLLALLYIMSGNLRGAIKVIIAFILLISIQFIDMEALGFLEKTLKPLAFMIRRFMLPVVSFQYMISTTPVGVLMTGVEKMRIPQVIVLPLAVMVRYFPTLKGEYKHIKNAMKMRGIRSGFYDVLRHPMLTLEYIMVPMLTSASRIGEELTAACHTKGVESPLKKVRYKEVSFSVMDGLVVILLIAILVVGIRGRI